MKVLVIDDEALVRRSLVKVFQHLGHDCYEAEDGIAGMQKWIEVEPDLVLLDVLMPKMSGPEVLTQMNQKLPTKVALMSAYTGEHTNKTAEQMGAQLFIAKPFDNIFDIARITLELVK